MKGVACTTQSVSPGERGSIGSKTPFTQTTEFYVLIGLLCFSVDEYCFLDIQKAMKDIEAALQLLAGATATERNTGSEGVG